MSRQIKLRSAGVLHARPRLLHLPAGLGSVNPWRGTHARDAGGFGQGSQVRRLRPLPRRPQSPGRSGRVPTAIGRATVSVSGSTLDAVPSTVEAANLHDVHRDPRNGVSVTDSTSLAYACTWAGTGRRMGLSRCVVPRSALRAHGNAVRRRRDQLALEPPRPFTGLPQGHWGESSPARSDQIRTQS